MNTMGAVTSPRYQFLLPPSVDDRLESLVTRCREDGDPASRSVIVGALIWGASAKGGGLGQTVRRYRREVVTAPQAPGAPRRRGPRPSLAVAELDS